jgi:hypothetical protein
MGVAMIVGQTIPRKRNASLFTAVAAAAAAAAMPLISRAATDTWSDGTGNWSAGANWSLGHVPFVGDIVNLTQSDGITRFVTYDAAATSGAGFASLTIDATGTGNMSLTPSAAGTLTATVEFVGFSGRGIYNLAAGVNNLTGTNLTEGLIIGYNAGSVGQFTMGNNTALNAVIESVGYSGTGTLTQNGGTNSFGTLNLGLNPAGVGTYNLDGGTVSGWLQVGNAGIGNFNQSGGLNNGFWLALGNTAGGAIGNYNLSNGTVSVPNQYVGLSGNGVFTQTGGTNRPQDLYLGFSSNNGFAAPATGTYALSAGLLAATDAEFIGINGNGVFNQSGGTNSPSSLCLGLYTNGTNPASISIYNLSNTASLTVTNSVYVGFYGNGIFNQTGGTHTVNTSGTNAFFVGYNAGASGTVNLSGGILSVTGCNEYVGNFGTGSINQSGGSNNIAQNLFVGSGTGSLGSYTLSGAGNLNVGGTEYIASAGAGNFIQSGGTHTVATWLYVGFATGSTGNFNLSGGTLKSPANSIGYLSGNNNAVNQTGGVFSATNAGSSAFITLADQPGARGTYNLSGAGAVIADIIHVGWGGIGTFNQTNGAATVNNLLFVAHESSAVGTYNLSGGALNALGSEDVGFGGNGTFNQSGGTNTINNGWLTLGSGSSAVGTYNLSGGTLVAGAGETIGDQGTGTFNQTGGSNSVAWGTLTIANTPGSSGSYNLSGGTLTAPVLNNGHFNQTGGTYNGTLTNNLSFTYGGGMFNGMFVQQPGGTFSFIAPANSFTAGAGITVYGTLAIAAGQTINGNGAGVDIEGGTVALAGGTIGGGTLLNNGLISGYGTIGGASFTNYAVINQGAGNLALNVGGGNGSGSAQNNGLINLVSGHQLQLIGAAGLVNAGSLELHAGLVTGPSGLTNAAGGIIIGPGTISAPFSNPLGTLAAQGGTLNVVQPFSNGGVIQIANATSGLVGGLLTNTGSVQGAGNIGNALMNAGTIEAIGGTLALEGAVTNTASGLLAASLGNKLLFAAGLPANSGTINFVGGTFDNNGHPLLNNGSISGYGILRSGGLANAPASTITFTGGFTTVNGDVTNSAGATIRAALNPVLFTGNVVNNGIIKITGAPTNTVTIAGTYSGTGTYNSDPADNYFLSDVNVGVGGQILGATGDRFFISGTYNNAGAYSNDGGALTGQNVINAGSFNQLAGQATILALSGTGSATVGGGAGTAVVSVSSLSQGSLTVNSGGTLTIRPTGSRLTNAATNFQISGNGTLDLSNHELLTNTAPATIKSYLANAFDAPGNQDWSRPGLTSSVARSNPVTYSLGYANGSDPSAQDAGVTTRNGTPLAPSQTIIRPVLTGDANMDGVVDFFDITQILGYKYNTGQQASYTDGDLDYSGKVDFFDIVLLLSANYNSGQTYLGAHTASPTLSRGVVASATTIGTTGDGKPDFEYDPATGHLRFRTDGGAFTTTGGSASFVSSLTITSTGGILLPGGASSPFAGGTGATLTSTLLSSALTNTPGFTDGFDIGIVLAPGLDAATLTADLTVKYQSLNGGSLKTADITVPEPVNLALPGLAAAGLVMRNRRRRTN